jgi:tripartite-type tricarboxylate transporter receptor subunit TctC
MKALAVTTKQRSALAPDVPTLQEAGVPGYELSVWFGILAPAGTPRDIVQRLNTEIVRILNSPEVKDRILKQGVEVQTSTPEQFDAFVKSEVARWANVIKDAGIKAD